MNILDIDIPYLNIVGLQKKGKFACPVCGPKIESRCSKSLRNEVFNEYRHFSLRITGIEQPKKIFPMGSKRLH